ncbi:MAG: hypothetical protein IJX99_07565 [Clostridia bacterium]|nr:hypothetical protein [Clostridia bacterium]
MLIEILSGIIIVLALINFILGIKLYEKPRENGYFNNVGELNMSRERTIAADPKYVLVISVITGILMGLYLGYAAALEKGGILIVATVIILAIIYLIEITRTVTLKENKLTLSKFLSFEKEIDVNQITGMYIYSYNKKFLKSHAYTTKLVITQRDGKITKFTLSSIDNKAILNMMKESFGINSYKMFISKHEN